MTEADSNVKSWPVFLAANAATAIFSIMATVMVTYLTTDSSQYVSKTEFREVTADHNQRLRALEQSNARIETKLDLLLARDEVQRQLGKQGAP